MIGFALLCLLSATGRPVSDLASLVPPNAIAYAELKEPGVWLARIPGSPLERTLKSLPAYEEFRAGPKGKNLEKFRAAYRAAASVDLEEALRRLVAQGLALGVVPGEHAKEPGLLLAARAADGDADFVSQTVEGIANVIAVVTKGEGVRREDEGEAIVVVLGEKVFAAALGSLTIVASSEALLKGALARAADTQVASLDKAPAFRAARKTASPEAVAFGYLDMARIATGKKEGKLIPELKDGGAAILFGALAETVNRAPFLTACLASQGRSVRLTFAAPVSPEEMRLEVRAAFFPSTEAERPARAAAPRDEFLTLRLYRDFEAIWNAREALGAGDDSGLRMATRLLFGGKRFEEDVLPHLGPELDLFLCRQAYPDLPRPPQVRFPGAVLVWRLKDAARFEPTLAMAFQTGVGLANAQRGQEGKAGLLLSTEKYGEATLHVARYMPPDGDGPLPIQFNAAPACAVVADHFYLSSSLETLKAAIDAGTAPVRPGDRLDLDATGLRRILAENEAALVSDNMLKKGNSRERAAAEVRTFLDLVGLVSGASLSLRAGEEGTKLEAVLRLLH